MKLEIHVAEVEWWFWAVTLALICAALAGWSPGYRAVMLVSAAQVGWFAAATGSVRSFPSQVRLVYFAVTLLALWTPIRFWVFLALAMGTAMVTLFGRCVIALALAAMPWNRRRPAAPRCDLPPAEAPRRASGAR
jgi:hypothetical protein